MSRSPLLGKCTKLSDVYLCLRIGQILNHLRNFSKEFQILKIRVSPGRNQSGFWAVVQGSYKYHVLLNW